jgi:enoyl-CoA hydratase/carnithine racemase
VRVIVLTGAGRGFCAGLDGTELAKSSAGGLRRMPAKGRRMTHPRMIRKPVIGAINGPAVGLGLVYALHCDIRFAAQRATFSTGFVKRGLNAEYGSSWLLPRIVGHARALELVLSARKIDAAEAERIGLVHFVVPDAELIPRVMAYAKEMAEQCSPIAMADAKQQIYLDWEVNCSRAEDRAKELGHSPGHRVDYPEGVAAFLERRSPRFAPLPQPD